MPSCAVIGTDLSTPMNPAPNGAGGPGAPGGGERSEPPVRCSFIPEPRRGDGESGISIAPLCSGLSSFPVPDKMIFFSCRSRAACYSVVRGHCRGDHFICTHGTDHSFGRVVPRGASVSSRMISHGSSNKLVSCLDTPSASGKSMGTAAIGSCRAVPRQAP
jgi:hypothetical protein